MIPIEPAGLEQRRPCLKTLGATWPLFLLLLGPLLAACRSEEPGEIVIEVTEVVMSGEQEVVVTRVVRRTVEVQATPMAETPEDPVVLDLSYQGGYESLDPQLTANENATDVIENIFAGLTRFNLESESIEPELAESWRTSADGRTWTFNLRDDIYWVRPQQADALPLSQRQEGYEVVRPVTAADVVFAVQRLCDPRLNNPDVFMLFIIEGCEGLYGKPEVTPEELAAIGVEAPDDQTVIFRLTKPASHFLTITSMGLLRPVPEDLILEMEDEPWALPGTVWSSGPFVLGTDSLPQSRTVLRHNPFWPIPFEGNVDQVNIVHLDTSDAFLLWEDRLLDASPVPLEDRARILARYELTSFLVPTHEVFYLGLNFDSPAFRELSSRQAFSWAIDRERLIREVHGGEALPMRHFTPSGIVGAPPIDEVGVGYSPDRARLVMDNSRFGDCRLMPEVIFMVSNSDLSLQQAELLRDMWVDELGCDPLQIAIEQVQFGTLLANTRPDAGGLRPDLWELGWAGYYPDANNWLNDVLHCTDSENRPRRPCSPGDDLLHEATTMTSVEERRDAYRQAENAFFGEEGQIPIIPLFVRANYLLRHGWVDFEPAAFGGEQYDTYLVDAAVKALERDR